MRSTRIRCLQIALAVGLPASAGLAQCDETSFRAADGASHDGFGLAVALSGDTALVGAPGDDDAGSSSGAAYVFEWSGSEWIEQKKLAPGGLGLGDRFGAAVSLDAQTALVGAWGDDDAGIDSGAAYVFERTPSGWALVQKLVGRGGAAGDRFGAAVSVAGDVAVVGAFGDDDEAGAAHVFERTPSGWAQTAVLVASDRASFDRFGASLSAFGEAVLVGARFHSLGGAAYFFERRPSGWIEAQKLVASDAEVFDEFGAAVALASGRALIGAPRDSGVASLMGSAYVFERGPSAWVETAELSPCGGAADDRFGSSVALAGDLALVGAPFDDAPRLNSGSAWVFEQAGSGWVEKGNLVAVPGLEHDRLGCAVSISGDRALAGADGVDRGGATDSGGCSVFTVPGGHACNYCVSLPNSIFASGARILAAGSLSVADNEFELVVERAVPGQIGLFCYGPERGQTPFGDGFLCIGGGDIGLFRLFPPRRADDSGRLARTLDLTAPPAGSGDGRITAGSSWNFQLWYRDPLGVGGSGFNLSDGLAVTFCP